MPLRLLALLSGLLALTGIVSPLSWVSSIQTAGHRSDLSLPELCEVVLYKRFDFSE